MSFWVYCLLLIIIVNALNVIVWLYFAQFDTKLVLSQVEHKTTMQKAIWNHSMFQSNIENPSNRRIVKRIRARNGTENIYLFFHFNYRIVGLIFRGYRASTTFRTKDSGWRAVECSQIHWRSRLNFIRRNEYDNQTKLHHKPDLIKFRVLLIRFSRDLERATSECVLNDEVKFTEPLHVCIIRFTRPHSSNKSYICYLILAFNSLIMCFPSVNIIFKYAPEVIAATLQ